MEEERYLHVSVRTLDLITIEVHILSSKLIADLKEELYLITGTPLHRQRLLLHGMQLEDDLTLEESGVEDTVYLVAFVQLEQQVIDLLALAVEGPVGLLRRRRSPAGESVGNDQVEAISQSLTTIESLVKSRFSVTVRSFVLGQWVDVRDTVDQWLEAQILAVQDSGNGPSVFVHYNGWPSRWDEWIQMSSPRIQPLRTHTFQALDSDITSPSPVIRPDFPGLVPRPFMCDLIKSFSGYIERLKRLLLKYTSRSSLKTTEISELRLLLDRFGRVMMDLAKLMEAGQLPVIETMTQVEGACTQKSNCSC
jgi:hypothetical protein